MSVCHIKVKQSIPAHPFRVVVCFIDGVLSNHNKLQCTCTIAIYTNEMIKDPFTEQCSLDLVGLSAASNSICFIQNDEVESKYIYFVAHIRLVSCDNNCEFANNFYSSMRSVLYRISNFHVNIEGN